MSADIPLNINIKEPRWNQSTFIGRASHFFTVTDPRNILLSGEQLENARKIVHDYRYLHVILKCSRHNIIKAIGSNGHKNMKRYSSH